MKQKDLELYLVYALMIEKTKERNVYREKPLFFSNRQKALEVVEHYQVHFPFLYESPENNHSIYCLVMEQFALDSTYRYQLSTWVFDQQGRLLCDCLIPDDGPFHGRPDESICHQLGEIVETPLGNQIFYGKIVEQPLRMNEKGNLYGLTASDDCYGVMRYPDGSIFYAHAPMVFKPTLEIDAEILRFFQE